MLNRGKQTIQKIKEQHTVDDKQTKRTTRPRSIDLKDGTKQWFLKLKNKNWKPKNPLKIQVKKHKSETTTEMKRQRKTCSKAENQKTHWNTNKEA